MAAGGGAGGTTGAGGGGGGDEHAPRIKSAAKVRALLLSMAISPENPVRSTLGFTMPVAS
jgi:hypothetical protein